MSDDPITSNTAWNELRDAANEGRISAREALERTLERANAVHGGQLAAIMLWFREMEAKQDARDNNQVLILSILQRGEQWQTRQEAAVSELRAEFQSFGERLDAYDQRLAAVEAGIRARDERSNRVHERVNKNSDRLDRIDRFIQEYAKLPAELREWKQATDQRITAIEDRMNESIEDRKGIHDRLTSFDQRHEAQWQEVIQRLAAIEQQGGTD